MAAWKLAHIRFSWVHFWTGLSMLAMGLLFLVAAWVLKQPPGAFIPGGFFALAGLLVAQERLGVSVSQDGKWVLSWYGFRVPMIATVVLKSSLNRVGEFRCIEVACERNYYILRIRGGGRDIYVDGRWDRQALVLLANELSKATGLPVE